MRQTVFRFLLKLESNGSRERSFLDSRSMLSQRFLSWAAFPPVGRCSLGDSFKLNIFVFWPFDMLQSGDLFKLNIFVFRPFVIL